MELTATQLALIASGSALVGVLITSVFNSINTLTQHRSDERKHRRELIIRSALEYWQQQLEVAKSSSKSVEFPPLDVYIVHMLKLSDALLSGEVNADNIKAKLAEAADAADAAMEFAQSRGTNG